MSAIYDKFKNHTLGEVIQIHTPEADEFLRSINVDRNHVITVDAIRGKRISIRKMRMIRAIKKARATP